VLAAVELQLYLEVALTGVGIAAIVWAARRRK